MVMSFCIVMIFIWFIKDIATRKIRESKRQYHRRLNFYLKQNQGLYEEKRKYAKAYHYGVEFTIFVAFLGACLMIQHLNANFESHEFALENKAIRESVIKKISPYVDQQKCLLSTSQDIYLAHYIFEDQLFEDLAHSHIKQSYIKVYTFHTEEEALDAISACSIFSESNSMIEVSRQSDKLFKYKGKIGYFYSEDGFVIKDRTSVIVMKNNDRLHDKLFDDEMSCLSQPLTKKEIRKIMKDMGYAV